MCIQTSQTPEMTAQKRAQAPRKLSQEWAKINYKLFTEALTAGRKE
jgi:hypothetical protein